MDRHDGARARCNGLLYQALVDVQCVRSDIDEDRNSPAEDKGIRCRDKGERRHDDLIARFEIEEQGGEFERCRARLCEQRAFAADVGPQSIVTFLREWAVARCAAAV